MKSKTAHQIDFHVRKVSSLKHEHALSHLLQSITVINFRPAI
ncbi:MAG: hypothetical protein OJF51_003528 [Nitrospira sp.]|nr:MAG: hypothetical protein OJF51_003528 [Nitrospira sp.]